MRISEIIEELQKLKDIYGDVDCYHWWIVDGCKNMYAPIENKPEAMCKCVDDFLLSIQQVEDDGENAKDYPIVVCVN